jgi:hypothetical protein
VSDAGLLVLQFFERLVDALLAESVDLEAFNQFVIAAFSGDGEANMVSLGMPYWPSDGIPMVTHLPLEPRAQSRMWSMAALAADAADDRPRASMMAAPRLPTVGRNTVAFQTWSLIRSLTFLPLTVAKR